MRNLGNLDSLSLGMGLSAKMGQHIPAEHSSLAGWSPLSEQEKSKKVSVGIFGTLLLVFLLYKLTR
jgi:hypothetical protein